MTIHTTDANLVIDTLHPNKLYCAFEHYVSMGEGQPPEIILVGACKLIDVYRLTDGKTNSDWATLFANGGSVMVRIIAVGDDGQEMTRFAMKHARSLPTMPRCNLRGYNVRGASRPVTCSNGKTYDSQKAASDELGISQSAISRHLRGELRHVGGFVFQYRGTVT